MMMGYYGFGGPFGGGAFGWLGFALSIILHLAFVVIVVLAAIWLLRAVVRGGHYAGTDAREPAAREPDALEIVRRRYARGEISAEEFQRLKKDLE